MSSLTPKFFTVLHEGYTRDMFSRDLVAGIVVGVVALPLAIAFGIASGVKPEQGLYTAIIAGFLISLFSGSRFQIGGPTGAFIVLVYAVVQEFGYDGLAVATIMAGILLVALGLSRMGTLIRYVPYPVTVGFTSGIAVVIASSQIKDAFGLPMGDIPAAFIAKFVAYAEVATAFNPWSVVLTAVTVLTLLMWPKIVRRIPASLIALVGATAATHLFHLPVATIGSQLGGVPSALPSLHLPQVDWAVMPGLVSASVSIALLAGIESLLSAVVADGMTGRRHRSNAELVGQGIANIVTPFFGGLPATGAIARTATNVKSGAASPVAGLVHALVLLVFLVAAGDLASLIPMPVLAGILLVVAWNMAETHLFKRILGSTRGDALVLLVTFGLTVFVDLTVAIQVGVVLAAFLFMKRMSEVAQIRSLGDDETDLPPAEAELLRSLPSGVEVYEVNGPFFFGAAHKFATALSAIQRRPAVLIIRMRHVLALDATGLRVLEEFLSDSAKHGTSVVLSGIHAQPLVLLERSGFMDRIGPENVHSAFEQAVDRAKSLLPEFTAP
ncbi:MAG: SulP family inorganic anion transporter [Rhodothermales bacterium]